MASKTNAASSRAATAFHTLVCLRCGRFLASRIQLIGPPDGWAGLVGPGSGKRRVPWLACLFPEAGGLLESILPSPGTLLKKQSSKHGSLPKPWSGKRGFPEGRTWLR